MKIQLKTDFYDYYDHQFDREGQVMERISCSGMSRREMFVYLEQIGLQPPPHGTPRQVYNSLPKSDQEIERYAAKFFDVVVYLNKNAHRGEGKILLPLSQALEEYPDSFCSLYCPTLFDRSESYRYLQIGDKIFWLRYTSNDWRSNYGEVDIEILSQEKDQFHPYINYPLFAVDFVVAPGFIWAIDFNIAPGIKGTGVEKILPAKEAVAAIKRWHEK